jgi:hypothetical protein
LRPANIDPPPPFADDRFLDLRIDSSAGGIARLWPCTFLAPPGHIVPGQVQLMQALRFRRGVWSPSVFNRICLLSVDFLFLKPDPSIVHADELDDASHDRPDRRDVAARKEHALWSAGVPLLRRHVGKMPDSAAIGTAVADVISVGRITAER